MCIEKGPGACGATRHSLSLRMPRIVASQTLATGRACAPSACVQWSDDGQVVVATKEALHILMPRVGAALEALEV